MAHVDPETKKAYARKYYLRHGDKVRASVRLYRNNNLELVRERDRKYRLVHLGTVTEYQRQYRIKNKQRLAIMGKAYREKNQDSIRLKHKEYITRNREKVRQSMKRRRLSARYGLSESDLETMRVQQCNRCAICQKDFNGSTPHVDHCHTSNKVRGLLCGGCNNGLGFLERENNWMNKALAYIGKYST